MVSAAARPTVTVFDAKEGEKKVVKNVALPGVLTAPIRSDLVAFIHAQVNKNRRQAYSVKDQAGMDYAAESWGTGRAVSRIPRIPGGGTNRAGQGAFGNMCRGGRMFHPTRTWRKWHKRTPQGQRRYAICAALAASAVPALVQARGHRISQVPELPLVLGGSGLGEVKKTKQALALLKMFGAEEDVQRAKDSKTLRAGKGKMRNRRFTRRRGPLVIHASSSADLPLAFRNIEGVDLCHVDRLNLLQLAPGGHVGRFVVWTEEAFARLDALYGTATTKATKKSDFIMPRPIVANADINRIINSEEIQKACRPIKSAKHETTFTMRKKNPLKNLGVMVKLNPYALVARRAEILKAKAKKDGKAKVVKKAKKASTRKSRKAFGDKLMAA